HRTLLPVPEDDFSNLSPVKLLMAKNSLKSNISKINKRIDEKYNALEKETDKHKRLILKSRIRKSEAKVHLHKLNLKKINSML
ncbi:MAG: hypothetical protein WBG90_18390, partial [Saonia sp.]